MRKFETGNDSIIGNTRDIDSVKMLKIVNVKETTTFLIK